MKIHASGQGKHAKGIISRDPKEGDEVVYYRSDYNKGERLVPLGSVKIRKI